MTFTVEGRTLANALKIAVAVIGRRNTIRVLSYVKLTTLKDSLRIQATDLDIELTTHIDMIDRQGSEDICLPATHLYRIAKAAGPANITIKPDGESLTRIEIDGGDAVFDVSPIKARDYPELQFYMPAITTEERFTNGRLSQLLAKVSVAVSSEETRYYLNGVAWQSNGEQRTLVATDGHRLLAARYAKDESAQTFSHIIPRKTVALLQRFTTGKDATAAASGMKAAFSWDRTVLRSKLIDGTFPDWRRVVPRFEDTAHNLVINRERIKQAIERVSIMFTEQGRAVRIHEKDGMANLAVKNADIGNASMSTFSPWPKGMPDIGVNINYLRSAIEGCSGPDITITATNNGAPVRIADMDEEMTRIVMPMRV